MNSVDQLKLEETWAEVEPILLPYEGAPSQVFVLDLPASVLKETVAVFCQRVMNPVITTLGGNSFDSADIIPCDAFSGERILQSFGTNGVTVLGGELTNDRYIHYWLCPSEDQTTFDAEIVFWADNFFTENKDKLEYSKSFDTVYQLARKIRETNLKSKWGVTDSDPREYPDKPYTVYFS